LTLEVTPLGVDADDEPPKQDGSGWARGWADAARLQRELFATAGPSDCRAAFTENLAAATEMLDYYTEVAARGENVGKALAEARTKVEWRKELLAEIEGDVPTGRRRPAEGRRRFGANPCVCAHAWGWGNGTYSRCTPTAGGPRMGAALAPNTHQGSRIKGHSHMAAIKSNVARHQS
jgi:hypothetical protein